MTTETLIHLNEILSISSMKGKCAAIYTLNTSTFELYHAVIISKHFCWSSTNALENMLYMQSPLNCLEYIIYARIRLFRRQISWLYIFSKNN